MASRVIRATCGSNAYLRRNGNGATLSINSDTGAVTDRAQVSSVTAALSNFNSYVAKRLLITGYGIDTIGYTPAVAVNSAAHADSWTLTGVPDGLLATASNTYLYLYAYPADTSTANAFYIRSGCVLTVTINYDLIPDTMRVNVGGVWKSGQPYVNNGGVWKQGDAWVKNAGGVWVQGI